MPVQADRCSLGKRIPRRAALLPSCHCAPFSSLLLIALQVDAVVYLVDAMDRERFPEAKKELDVRTYRRWGGERWRMM